MFSVFFSGLRSLRVSLITGGLLVASVYIFLYGIVADEIAMKPGARNLVEFSTYVPIILFVTLCLIVGSLYTTLLEGIVDSLHKKNVLRKIDSESSIWERTILSAFLPYSDSAKTRLIAEVERFYREYTHKNDLNFDAEQRFIAKVMIEVLWMEGKLAGTVLESPYDKIRSEGEMRVSGGLLLPLASTTAAFSISASELEIIFCFLVGVAVAIPTVNYGLYYYRKANSFFAHHVADGTILSPSMETLKRARRESLPINEHALAHSD